MASSWGKKMYFLVLLVIFGLLSLLLQHFSLSRSSLQEPRCLSADNSPVLRVLHNDTAAPVQTEQCSCTKTVLMYSFPYYYELKAGAQVFAGCDHRCTLWLEAERTAEADCVVFYSHHSQARSPPVRSPNSVWVYFAVESPIYSANHLFGEPAWKGHFNWTMTYRHDSDMYFGYGELAKLPAPAPRDDLVDIYRKKTKLVAWFVSNCNTQSKRETFVAALKNHIPVDVYGRCGELRCGAQGDTVCNNMLSRDYYFYLSFENSLCKDYITEKLYRTMKIIDVIPVVRGRANYTALLPKNSFIDASSFSSVKELGDFLKKLAADEAAYLSYLEWKKEWKVIEPMPFPFCELCRRLHNQHRFQKVHDNIDDWWRKGVCMDPPSVS